MESAGTRGRAPYDVVLTHGFTLDENGRKMSKSLGNTVEPQKVIAQSGADILRLWVCATDYADDQRIGPEILKNTIETYRKLRNTIRWMLGTLHHFKPADAVAPADMPELERLMLHRLSEIDAVVREAYAAFDYKTVVASLTHFMNTDLSAFYFDIRKDALYCDPPSSVTRKAALTTVDILCDAILKWLAPITSFTADEAWFMYRRDGSPSVHLLTFPDHLSGFRDDALATKWQTIRNVRRVVTGALELERAAKRIGSSLEASPLIYVSDRQTLATACSTSISPKSASPRTTRCGKTKPPAAAFRLDGVPGVAVVVEKAAGRKCARSWKILPTVGDDAEYPDVSPRDASRFTGMEGDGSYRLSLHLRYGVIAAIATLVLDQASKFWLVRIFDIAHRGTVKLTPFFDLVLAWNQGISFGWFQNDGAAAQFVLMAIKVVAVVVLAVWMARSRTLIATVALGLIIGGAIGNGIDRLAYGAVVDFALFHVHIGENTFNWYVFNLADVAIVAGVVALLYDSFWGIPAAKAP